MSMEPLTFVPSKPQGIMGIQERGKPAFVWQRDLGNCLPMIVRNAIITTQLTYEGNAEAMKALDIIGQMTAKFYTGCRADNVTGLANMSSLMDYIGESEVNKDVYATFCSMLFVSIFTFLFASKEMAVALPEGLTNDAYDYHMFLQMWCMLPEEKRQDYLQEVKSKSCLTNRIDLSKLSRPVTDYLTAVKAAQEAMLKQLAETGK
jgi:hypothetical protein